MRIVLFGAPGSGKGTLGEMLERAYGFPRISTGDLLRKAVREGTPLGRRAEGIMAQGGLVPDEVVTGIVRERIAAPDCAAGYILDGYPRTIAQAEALARIDGGRSEIVISFEVGLPSLIERLCGRRVCSSCGAIFHLTRKAPRREGLCDACGAGLLAPGRRRGRGRARADQGLRFGHGAAQGLVPGALRLPHRRRRGHGGRGLSSGPGRPGRPAGPADEGAGR